MKRASEYQVGEKIQNSYIGIISADILPYSRGTYLLIKFNDGAAIGVGKKWNHTENDLIPEVGKVYNVSGEMKDFRGKYIDISNIELNTEPDAIKYVTKTSYIPKDNLKQIIRSAVDSIENKEIKEFTEGVISGELIHTQENYFDAPSAVGIHHNFLGGNAQHSTEVLEYALSMANVKNKTTGDRAINLDLIKMGALLHDIGKLNCYTMKIFEPQMTEIGKLNDHIVEGIGLLYEAINNFCTKKNLPQKPNWFKLLIHIVASHHENLEWGSPVKPSFEEALIIARADNMSASLISMSESIKNIDAEDGFENKRNFQFQTRLYKLNNEL